MNAYLQRPEVYAFASSQRHLSALILRKRLGSSTYAVASTLEGIANRLEAELRSGHRRDNRGGLIDEEIEASDALPISVSDSLALENRRQEAAAEVQELRDYAEFARSITVNQKAVKLLEALDQGFAKLAEIGAPQKAIIFTDSTKTQEYLAASLRGAGRGDGLVLFNGSNNSPESTRIYQDQFRSMLVNYDLPWNPQRVEQCIGRVHRYGQAHNVTVVNFSNQGNLAEERILELLTEKFNFFASVFGASDEVLGTIEDGLDFERSIAGILERCKTAAEINAAFDELESQYATEINDEMQKARARVFDNLDPNVQDKLKDYDTQKDVVLNAFERLLIQVTRHELDAFAEFDEDGRTFTLLRAPGEDIPTDRYFFKSTPVPGAHQYRYNSDLGQYVVAAALGEHTPIRELVFSIDGSERAAADARTLRGSRGVLTVDLLRFEISAGNVTIIESYLLATGLTDDGAVLDAEQVEHLLDLACAGNNATSTVDTTALRPALDAQAAAFTGEVQTRTAQFSIEQGDLVESRLKDHKAKYDAEARKLERAREEINARERRTDDLTERLRLRKEAQKLSRRADDLYGDYREERDRLRGKADEYIGMLADALGGTEHREHVFTIRWAVLETAGHSDGRQNPVTAALPQHLLLDMTKAPSLQCFQGISGPSIWR
ncbi:C-terminal helicase domain-containing protein [Microbacterium ulmi]|uniref:C-terminal helicase domain-containing protein n=1 Tax=Microbacterium ulmi TaxID=179095 RepID=UPI001FB8A15F|nr:C-terminal helicase domain-containing protein [Microbacterium ulmi]NII69827.1 hypothetical protein [Microbacterium ulmi]